MTSIDFHRVCYAPGHAMAPHVDGCRRLSIVLSGTLLESHERSDDVGGPGSVAIKSADCVHGNRFGDEGTVILSIVLPDPVLEALDLASRWRSWKWLHEGPPRRAALRLALAGMRRDGVAAAGALGELAGFLREGAPAIRSAPPSRARLDALRAQLHEDSQDPQDPERELSVTRIARETGLHPVTVGVQFRRAFGCSIRDYRQRLRAERTAVALLASRVSHTSLTSIALRHGFYDLSHLTRVFRREYGAPPGAFRKALAPGGPALQSSKTSWSVAL